MLPSTANEARSRAPNRVEAAYASLLEAFGPQGWWPSDTSFETALGAILTQGTAWSNAERAIANLRAARVLTAEAMGVLDSSALESMVRPAGFYRRKTETIRGLTRMIGGTSDGWKTFLTRDTDEMRARLLALRGVGPETADAIILYAAERPVFVVDTYTRRFCARHSLSGEGASYDDVRRLFESSLPRRQPLYAEFHALLVRLGKDFCRRGPLCENCPLRRDLCAED